MNDFIIGDEVMIQSDDIDYSGLNGFIGVITAENGDGSFIVRLNDHGNHITVYTKDIKRHKPTAFRRIDTVNHPDHYTQGGIECIDAIEASMSKDEFHGYLKGNAIKYIWRYKEKGKAVEDIEKAMWYLNRLHNSLDDKADV